MSDRYAVFGNPVAQSKSPAIHAAFAKQAGHDVSYERILAPLDGFEACVRSFIANGGSGANVTLPFKGEAFAMSTVLSPRAQAAAAVNTLRFNDAEIYGDNTDGAGLLADIERNLGFQITGRRVLVVGAGGAARGVILPLLGAGPSELVITNRTIERAEALAAQFRPTAILPVFTFSKLTGQIFDLVINATSASLSDVAPALPEGLYSRNSLAYDMVYKRGDTPFMLMARAQGARRAADGLGMLVEQAAESFFIWRGVRPQSAPVLTAMRAAPHTAS